MEVRLNREIKAFCPDFTPVRQELQALGAEFVEVKEQTDFFYHLPPSTDGVPRRLKLRVEPGQTQVIYYYDRQEGGARTSRFQLWQVADEQIQDVLNVALGVKVVVRKQRELWRKDNTVFNLDTVDGVGQVFEAELPA